MAFTTGTATDYHNLLSALHTYLLAQGWTVDEWLDGGSVTSVSRLCVTAPGNVGGQQPKVAFQTDWDTAANSYAWQLTAYPVYDSDLAFGLQENCSPITNFCLWADTIDYWFYVNDTRVIVIAKIGTYYMSLYAGFFLPYALPAEYPYPYFIGATYSIKKPYNFVNAAMRSFCDPGFGAAYYMRRTSLTWGMFANSDREDNSDDAYIGQKECFVWPYRAPYGNNEENNPNDLGFGFFHLMRPIVSGNMPLFQCQIIDAEERIIPGCLDGVFATPGFNRLAEQVVAVGADDYRLFINIARNTPKGFFAIKEE